MRVSSSACFPASEGAFGGGGDFCGREAWLSSLSMVRRRFVLPAPSPPAAPMPIPALPSPGRSLPPPPSYLHSSAVFVQLPQTGWSRSHLTLRRRQAWHEYEMRFRWIWRVWASGLARCRAGGLKLKMFAEAGGRESGGSIAGGGGVAVPGVPGVSRCGKSGRCLVGDKATRPHAVDYTAVGGLWNWRSRPPLSGTARHRRALPRTPISPPRDLSPALPALPAPPRTMRRTLPPAWALQDTYCESLTRQVECTLTTPPQSSSRPSSRRPAAAAASTTTSHRICRAAQSSQTACRQGESRRVSVAVLWCRWCSR